MRKLAIACFSFSIAVFISNYVLPHAILPVAAILFLAGAVYFIIRPAKFLRPVIISFISLSVGFGLFFVNAHSTSLKAEKYVGLITELEARLITYPKVYDDYCRAEIKLSSPSTPAFKAVLYDNSMGIADAKPGDLVNFSGKLSSAGTRYGEAYDHYYSKDIYFVINSRSDVEVLNRFDVRALPQIVNRYMTEHIEGIFPQDTAAFIKSLLLGDKTDLYEMPEQYNDLSRAGLSHIVAVSGMHIAYLVAVLHILLGKNRRSSVLVIAIVWAFVFISGASPSALRAGIMQTVFLLAPVFRRENDAVTSISFALAIILLFNPYAAASVSLQLSFAAMAGIMLFGTKISEKLSDYMPSCCKGIAVSAGTSASGMILTVPLVAVHFGVVNLLSVVSNVLALWAVSICFCGAYLACFTALVSLKLGSMIAWCISWLVRYILWIADIISSIPFSAVYLNNTANIIWLIISYIFFIICALSRLKAVYKMLIPISLSAVILAVCSGIVHSYYRNADAVFTAIDVGQGQCLSVMSKDSTIMIDCGGISSLDNAGETAAAYLSSCGRRKLDLLILTHLHSDHANGVGNLLEMLDVERIILPSEPNDDDEIYDSLLGCASRSETELEFVSDMRILDIEDIGIKLWKIENVGDINERGLIAQVSVGEYDMLVTGDASSSVERKLIKDEDISGIDLLVVGHHGSRYSSCGDFLEHLNAGNAIISCGYNTFGHPTHEVLARLEAYGYNIYRTDLNGNIEIRLG